MHKSGSNIYQLHTPDNSSLLLWKDFNICPFFVQIAQFTRATIRKWHPLPVHSSTHIVAVDFSTLFKAHTQEIFQIVKTNNAIKTIGMFDDRSYEKRNCGSFWKILSSLTKLYNVHGKRFRNRHISFMFESVFFQSQNVIFIYVRIVSFDDLSSKICIKFVFVVPNFWHFIEIH